MTFDELLEMLKDIRNSWAAASHSTEDQAVLFTEAEAWIPKLDEAIAQAGGSVEGPCPRVRVAE